MNPQRSEWIRKGNRAFNDGKIHTAGKIFQELDYKDGLIRVGDYLYYEKHQPLMAMTYYQKANQQHMLDKIYEGFVFALQCMLSEGKDDDVTSKAKVETKDESQLKQDNASSQVQNKHLLRFPQAGRDFPPN